MMTKFIHRKSLLNHTVGCMNHDRIQQNLKSMSRLQWIAKKRFQPFFTTKPTGEGTGLGLSLSYDIVKAHGVAITVESTENSGTEFCITLPIKP